MKPRFTKILCCVMGLLLLTSNAAFAQADFASDFQAAAKAPTGVMIRYWLPGAPIDLAQMRDEITAMADVGVSAIELALVADSGDNIDPAYRWDTEKWYEALVEVLKTAKEVGIRVDLTVSAHWPLMIPGVGLDSEAAQKVLKSGIALLAPGETYEGEVPASDTPLPEGATVDTLKAVVAVKVNSYVKNPNAGQSSGGWGAPPEPDFLYDLDSTTLVSVEIGEGNTIRFTAPDADADYNAQDEASKGKWAIISYWQRGNAQQPSGARGAKYTNEPAYVVDHFGLAGTQAFIDYWNENLLTDEVRALLADVGGSFFEDSLEVSGTLVWTDDFLSAFEANMGYDIAPYLPALSDMLDDTQFAMRIRQDYEQVLNDIYIENHVMPIQAFANSLGMTFRTQSYGGTVDSSQTAQIVDIIEGELLTFGGASTMETEWTVDNKFRVLRGGVNMGAKNIVSDEIGSLMNGDWVLPQDRILELMNGDFSAGVNNMVMHGYPYKYFSGASWPTGMTFSPVFGSVGFGTVFSNALPNWVTMDEFVQYINRTQFLLQAGQSDVDVAIYRDETSLAKALIPDGMLVDAGYTYDYISPANLTDDNPNAAVVDGVLAAKTASYKAMIIYGADSITIEGAGKMIEYAKAGLPVIFVGETPVITRGYSQADADAQVTALLAELLVMEQVTQVADAADVSLALAERGVLPDASLETSDTHLTAVHRRLDDADVYYLFNRGYDHTIAQDIRLAGSGNAYLLDAYTGKVTRIPEAVESGDGTLTLPISLKIRDAALILLSENASYDEGAIDPVAATGEGEAVEVSSWTLSLEAWLPELDDVMREDVVQDLEDFSRFNTIKTTQEITLDTVRAWSEIEGYEDVCGIGTYTAAIQITADQVGKKAVLQVGAVDSSFEVYINGEQALANLVTGDADITGYLVEGENTLSIVVPSEMINALRVVRSNIYGDRARTVNGLQENPVLRFE